MLFFSHAGTGTRILAMNKREEGRGNDKEF